MDEDGKEESFGLLCDLKIKWDWATKLLHKVQYAEASENGRQGRPVTPHRPRNEKYEALFDIMQS